MRDDATINNRVGHKNYYAKKAMPYGCLIVISCSVRDLNPIGLYIHSWMAALKSNGRQAGWLLCTNTGLKFLAAVHGDVLKLIIIVIFLVYLAFCPYERP